MSILSLRPFFRNASFALSSFFCSACIHNSVLVNLKFQSRERWFSWCACLILFSLYYLLFFFCLKGLILFLPQKLACITLSILFILDRAGWLHLDPLFLGMLSQIYNNMLLSYPSLCHSDFMQSCAYAYMFLSDPQYTCS